MFQLCCVDIIRTVYLHFICFTSLNVSFCSSYLEHFVYLFKQGICVSLLNFVHGDIAPEFKDPA
jgi:hypothetical protein